MNTQRHRRPLSHTEVGFTLLELLVALVVIGIVAALLLPAFARARERANQAVCASNLRQIGLATLQYVQDNDGALFPRPYKDAAGGYVRWSFRDWHSKLDTLGGCLGPYPTSAALWQCPSASGVEGVDGGPNFLPAYALNAEISQVEKRRSPPVPLAAVGVPSETILAADAALLALGTLSGALDLYAPFGHDSLAQGRHGGLANVLWLDGHVTARRPVPTLLHMGPEVSLSQIQRYNLGFILRGPYTGNARTDGYYYELTKPQGRPGWTRGDRRAWAG